MINLKKIVILLLCFILTGCFENSGYLVKTCTNVEKSDTFTGITTYTFGFKNDVIDDLKITYDYQDTNSDTIAALKLSLTTQNNFLKLAEEVLVDTPNQYKITYQLPLNPTDEIKDKFVIRTSRTDLVNNLKEKGFTCE